MPRRSLLTPAERIGLLAFPTTDEELIRHYTLLGSRSVGHPPTTWQSQPPRLCGAVVLSALSWFLRANRRRTTSVIAGNRWAAVAHQARHLAAVFRATGDPALTLGRVAGVAEHDHVRHCRLSALCPPSCRAGPANRPRYRAGRGIGRTAAIAHHHTAD